MCFGPAQGAFRSGLQQVQDRLDAAAAIAARAHAADGRPPPHPPAAHHPSAHPDDMDWADDVLATMEAHDHPSRTAMRASTAAPHAPAAPCAAMRPPVCVAAPFGQPVVTAQRHAHQSDARAPLYGEEAAARAAAQRARLQAAAEAAVVHQQAASCWHASAGAAPSASEKLPPPPRAAAAMIAQPAAPAAPAIDLYATLQSVAGNGASGSGAASLYALRRSGSFGGPHPAGPACGAMPAAAPAAQAAAPVSGGGRLAAKLQAVASAAAAAVAAVAHGGAAPATAAHATAAGPSDGSDSDGSARTAAALAAASLECFEECAALSSIAASSGASCCDVGEEVDGPAARVHAAVCGDDDNMADAVVCVTAAAGSARRHQRVMGGLMGSAAATAAAPAGPPAAGGSALRRLLCARVSVFTDACSPGALAVANTVMSSIVLPGGISFVPVSPDTATFQLSAAWGLPSFAVTLGSSYFQRMIAALPPLEAAARRCPAFAALCGPLPAGRAPVPFAPPSEAAALEAQLRSTEFTCIFLATKIADQVHAYGLLRYMLTALTGQRHPVTQQQAADVELRCLETLGWRLGPYFGEDPCGDNTDALIDLFCGR